MIKIGMIGLSPGNGHPYSFSAIFNGYDEQEMARCPYPRIYNYLRSRSPSEFGIADTRVTHVWTPERKDAEKIARACHIPNIVDDLLELPNLVDAAIIARDDTDSHWPIARPFLDRSVPVFVDAPLAADMSDLRNFEPFLRCGKAMTCSALRYAVEVDSARTSLVQLGEIRAVHAICLEKGWFEYGVHVLESCYSLLGVGAVSVRHVGTADCHTVRVRFSNGLIGVFQVTEGVERLFQLGFFGTGGGVTVVVSDIFAMFRRTLAEFVRMVQTGVPPIVPSETVEIVKVVIAGGVSLADSGREVLLSELS